MNRLTRPSVSCLCIISAYISKESNANTNINDIKCNSYYRTYKFVLWSSSYTNKLVAKVGVRLMQLLKVHTCKWCETELRKVLMWVFLLESSVKPVPQCSPVFAKAASGQCVHVDEMALCFVGSLTAVGVTVEGKVVRRCGSAGDASACTSLRVLRDRACMQILVRPCAFIEKTTPR